MAILQYEKFQRHNEHWEIILSQRGLFASPSPSRAASPAQFVPPSSDHLIRSQPNTLYSASSAHLRDAFAKIPDRSEVSVLSPLLPGVQTSPLDPALLKFEDSKTSTGRRMLYQKEGGGSPLQIRTVNGNFRGEGRSVSPEKTVSTANLSKRNGSVEKGGCAKCAHCGH